MPRRDGQPEYPASVQAGMPYEAMVDAARGGATIFGQPRPYTREEKLSGALGSLQSFFGRIGAIGTPPEKQGQLIDLISEGQERLARVQRAPYEEAMGASMQAAAAAKAQADAEAEKEQRRMATAQLLGKFMPDIGPRQVPLPDGQAGQPSLEQVPPGLLAEALQSGDISKVMPFVQPGLSDQRNFEQQRSLAREGDEAAMAREKEQQSGANYRAKLAAEGRKKPGDGKLSYQHARQQVGDIIKRFPYDPAKAVDALEDFAAKNAIIEDGEVVGSNLSAEAVQYLETQIDALERSAGGGAADEPPPFYQMPPRQ